MGSVMKDDERNDPRARWLDEGRTYHRSGRRRNLTAFFKYISIKIEIEIWNGLCPRRQKAHVRPTSTPDPHDSDPPIPGSTLWSFLIRTHGRVSLSTPTPLLAPLSHSMQATLVAASARTPQALAHAPEPPWYIVKEEEPEKEDKVVKKVLELSGGGRTCLRYIPHESAEDTRTRPPASVPPAPEWLPPPPPAPSAPEWTSPPHPHQNGHGRRTHGLPHSRHAKAGGGGH